MPEDHLIMSATLSGTLNKDINIDEESINFNFSNTQFGSPMDDSLALSQTAKYDNPERHNSTLGKSALLSGFALQQSLKLSNQLVNPAL